MVDVKICFLWLIFFRQRKKEKNQKKERIYNLVKYIII